MCCKFNYALVVSHVENLIKSSSFRLEKKEQFFLLAKVYIAHLVLYGE